MSTNGYRLTTIFILITTLNCIDVCMYTHETCITKEMFTVKFTTQCNIYYSLLKFTFDTCCVNSE